MLEDSEWEAELIQKHLKKELPLCVLELAFDQQSFLQALENFRPDIILSDNSLPGYSGSEALDAVRQRTQYIPFILITGTVSDEFAAAILKAGADDYILKDRLERLPAAIAAAIKQRKTEKELYDYKQALDASSIVAITDPDGVILYANENFVRISQYTVEELVGENHRIVNSDYHPASFFKEMWDTIIAGKIWRGEIRNRTKDGTAYWVDCTIVPFLTEDGLPYQYLSIRNDITQKKLAEEAMLLLTEQMHEQQLQEQKKIARAIIHAQEKERNHLGQELHDNVNQILAGTSLYLSMAAKNNPGSEELILYARELVKNAMEEIRTLSAKQVTPIKDVNLQELIQNLLNNLESSTAIETNFLYKANIVDDDLKLNIYRIVQEQVNNILKHAEANVIDVLIEITERSLLIQVRDDGKGFDPNKQRNGIGITNMLNRIESFNGKMWIESQPGEGCTIRTTIPVV
jgi:two-component system sensor histidine kinase NreB